MNENRKQILEMLSHGKISAEEAERLIAALERESANDPKKETKYLRVLVESTEGSGGAEHPTKVNIRIPMQLLRAGVKLASLIPVQARKHVNEALHEHGLEMDLSQLTPQNLEELINHLNDLTVDVDDAGNRVRVFCE